MVRVLRVADLSAGPPDPPRGLGRMIQRDGIRAGGWSFALTVAAMLVATAIAALRRPEKLLTARFLNEDGVVFFMGAFGGIGSLFEPYEGFLYVPHRLIALLEHLVPTAYAPLVGNTAALLVAAAVAVFVASDRMSSVLPDRRVRIALGLLLLLLPSSHETLGSLTWAQWYAAVFLLLASWMRPATTAIGATVGIGAVMVAGFAGPFSVLFAPLYWLRAWRLRDLESRLLAIGISVAAVLQASAYLTSRRVAGPPLDPADIPSIIAFRVFDVPFIGSHLGLAMSGLGYGAVFLMAAAVLVGVTVLVIRGRRPIHWLALYGGTVVLVASLAGAYETTAQFMDGWAAARYFLVPGFLITAVAVEGAMVGDRVSRWVGMCLTAVLLIGIAFDVRLPPQEITDWPTASECIGGPEPCVVHVEPGGKWDIHWPGLGEGGAGSP